MKKILLFIFSLSLIFFSCKKMDTSQPSPTNPNEGKNITANTIIVNSTLTNSLLEVDSTKLIFSSNGIDVDQVKVGSILVSDISTKAPLGFLRKVTGITSSGDKKVFSTEQASLTDVIVNGKVSLQKTITDDDLIGEDSSGVDISLQKKKGGKGLSLTFPYSKVLYDADGNEQTQNDQVRINGSIKIEPSFNFYLDIKGSQVKQFTAKLILKNTNNISIESKAVLVNLEKEIVLKTFMLKPFTIVISGIPIPIAKQWIAIVLGVDGNLTARISAGAQNTNTAVAGISYENNSWNTISTVDTSFSFQPLSAEGSAKIEPYLQARYEIRPYGIKQSRIYLGVTGSIIGEATATTSGLNTSLEWGIKLSAEAQMKIWDHAIIDYEKVFYEREFPIISQQGIILGWKELVAGGNHSLGIKTDGSLWAWGLNNYGQLGDGTLANENKPVRIGNSNDWRQVMSCQYSSYGIKSDGSLWAWGWNGYGQLGDGTTTSITIPKRIGNSNDWKQLQLGVYYCLALKSDGSLWAWGWNEAGQLGDGTLTDKHSPIRIGNTTNWKQIAASGNQSFGIKSDGSLWAWGANGFGQLGDGTQTNRTVAVKIGNSSDWEQIIPGLNHTLGIKSDGSLWAWGYNNHGQLGDGTQRDMYYPEKIDASNDWKQIVASSEYNLGIKSDGSLWAWGSNDNGQLGNGTKVSSNNPIKIGTSNTWQLITAGNVHNFGIMLDGSVWAWGWNYYGQFGDGTNTDRLVPTKITN